MHRSLPRTNAARCGYFIDEVMTRHGGIAKELPESKRQGLKPPAAVPSQLVESAQADGIALTQAHGRILTMTSATCSSSWE